MLAEHLPFLRSHRSHALTLAEANGAWAVLVAACRHKEKLAEMWGRQGASPADIAKAKAKIWTISEYVTGRAVNPIVPVPAGGDAKACPGDVDDPWEQKKGATPDKAQGFFNAMVNNMNSLVGPVLEKAHKQATAALAP